MIPTTNPIRNLLIVESHNDAAFIRLLLQDLGISADIDVVIEDLHKFMDESGQERRGKTEVAKKLEVVKGGLERRYLGLEKLGIILDFDQEPPWDRAKNLKLINGALSAVFTPRANILKEAEFIDVDSVSSTRSDYAINFQSACFFTKDSSGKGNLDTLLLEIRNNKDISVPYADCLALWRDCVNKNNPDEVKENEYAKIWLSNMLRAKAKELGKEGKRIRSDFEARQSEVIQHLGANLFDLNHPSLIAMRDFLALFK